jgi:hypothetical protein
MDYLNQTGLPDYRATPGNQGVTVLRRLEEDVAHFTLISYWDSLESIRAFAGDNLEVARYYPEDEVFYLKRNPPSPITRLWCARELVIAARQNQPPARLHLGDKSNQSAA